MVFIRAIESQLSLKHERRREKGRVSWERWGKEGENEGKEGEREGERGEMGGRKERMNQ